MLDADLDTLARTRHCCTTAGGLPALRSPSVAAPGVMGRPAETLIQRREPRVVASEARFEVGDARVLRAELLLLRLDLSLLLLNGVEKHYAEAVIPDALDHAVRCRRVFALLRCKPPAAIGPLCRDSQSALVQL